MRIEQEAFQEWNMMMRMLVGVTNRHISNNMRRVGLRKEGEDWIVEVILEKDDPEDREEAEEFASELWILSEDNAEGAVRSRVIVDDGPPENFPKFEKFAGSVYWRKED
ncbi:hypothetical protein [Sphingobium sp. B12D2B]|uniref:hypothetical protein n=1 Tax=Sphingobium sp. B12D2B TaxID=2940577 RepID=UPI0022243993|nr:hypothetical protein [Sphingobium sp. B12D2B]MCW2351799.1 hypothetical protein [Sphingobium sp. B12D2B]